MGISPGVKLDYTRPGQPTDNGLIESFNGRLRDEFLNVHEFITLHDAREKLKAWQENYNHHRSHGSLGHLTPSGSSREVGAKQRSDVNPIKREKIYLIPTLFSVYSHL